MNDRAELIARLRDDRVPWVVRAGPDAADMLEADAMEIGKAEADAQYWCKGLHAASSLMEQRHAELVTLRAQLDEAKRLLREVPVWAVDIGPIYETGTLVARITDFLADSVSPPTTPDGGEPVDDPLGELVRNVLAKRRADAAEGLRLWKAYDDRPLTTAEWITNAARADFLGWCRDHLPQILERAGES